jgi:hypothetical protein
VNVLRIANNMGLFRTEISFLNFWFIVSMIRIVCMRGHDAVSLVHLCGEFGFFTFSVSLQ